MIEIYTDGAYSSSRDQGGWAFVVVKDDELLYKDYDGLLNTTNQRMEIIAMIKTLEFIKNYSIPLPITIYSDSLYVINTITKNWNKKLIISIYIE